MANMSEHQELVVFSPCTGQTPILVLCVSSAFTALLMVQRAPSCMLNQALVCTQMRDPLANLSESEATRLAELRLLPGTDPAAARAVVPDTKYAATLELCSNLLSQFLRPPVETGRPCTSGYS